MPRRGCAVQAANFCQDTRPSSPSSEVGNEPWLQASLNPHYVIAPILSLFQTLPVAGFLGVQSLGSSVFIATRRRRLLPQTRLPTRRRAHEARPSTEGQLPVTCAPGQRTGVARRRDEARAG